MNERIYHLLKPKEYRVWCRASKEIQPQMNVTNLPSKATCANCLSAFRYQHKLANPKAKGTGEFRVRWTQRNQPHGDDLRYAK